MTVGLAGCGEIARRHAREIAAHPEIGLRLLSVTDIDVAAGTAFAGEHALHFAPSLEDLLAEPLSLICICTPNATHAPIALRALEAGRHVLIEHPMAMTAADAELLIEAARRAGRQIFVVRQRRFSRAVQTIRTAMTKGVCGNIRDVEMKLHWSRRTAYFDDRPWRRRRENGGVIANQGSHFLDLLLYLFGEPVGLSGTLGNVLHAIECEDAARGTIEFSGGVRAQFECTTAAPEGWNSTSLQMHGDEGTIALVGRDLDQLGELAPAVLTALASSLAPPVSGDHRGYLERVARRIAGESVEIVDGREGARAVRLIESIYATFRREDAPLREHFANAFGGTAA
ncbi:MAG: Gfo/Idh/MocA family protein [Thermoanaerobaculia bacterium]